MVHEWSSLSILFLRFNLRHYQWLEFEVEFRLIYERQRENDLVEFGRNLRGPIPHFPEGTEENHAKYHSG
jgi:hypothetical protein